MNTLVVYDSLFGNTEQIAQIIADRLSAFGEARAVRLEPAQSVEVQRQASLRQYKATDSSLVPAEPVELQGVDLLIVGCPTQGFRATPTMQSFLTTIPLASFSQLAVATFDTRVHGPFGSAARHINRLLRAKNVKLVVPPESFFVQGTPGPLKSDERARAANWACTVLQKVEDSRIAAR